MSLIMIKRFLCEIWTDRNLVVYTGNFKLVHFDVLQLHSFVLTYQGFFSSVFVNLISHGKFRKMRVLVPGIYWV